MHLPSFARKVQDQVFELYPPGQETLIIEVFSKTIVLGKANVPFLAVQCPTDQVEDIALILQSYKFKQVFIWKHLFITMEKFEKSG